MVEQKRSAAETGLGLSLGLLALSAVTLFAHQPPATVPPCSLLDQPVIAFLSASDSVVPPPGNAGPSRPPPPGPPASPGTYDLVFRVVNPLPHPLTCVFLPNPSVALAQLYPLGGTEPSAKTGAAVPLGERALRSPRAALPAVVEPGIHSFVLRIRVPANAPRPAERMALQAESLEAFMVATRRSDHGNGIYGGIMLAVVLYNLFLFLSLRERLYLLYVLYASSFGAIWLIRAGMGLVFLWPGWPLWDAQAHYYAIGAAMLFGNAFTRAFLELPAHAPVLSRALLFLSASVGVVMAGTALQQFQLIEKPLAVLALATCALYVASGVVRVRQGSQTAVYFLLATGMVIAGTVVYTLAYLELLPVNGLTANGAQLGSAAEMVLLAFALGHRIRELRTRHAEAEKLSLTDPLTGLANRRLLDGLLEQEWRRAFRQRSSLALVVVDVDHFKAYNDACGHQAGDRILQLLALELKALCRRPGDVAARYGGEEFVLLLPGISGSQARQLAERLRQAVERQRWPHPASPVSESVTVSCGVAVGRPAEGVPVGALFGEADEALYQAKRSGRNRIHVRTASGSHPRLAGA